MEFVAAGCCTRKWLRYYQTLRNLTFGDLGILLVVIRLRITGLKKTRVVYVLDFFQGRGKTGQFDLVHGERLQVIWLMVAMLMSYSRMVSVVLILWSVGPILRNGCGI